jgi:hypothetical protein
VGVNMGFNRFSLWEKGIVTFFPFGAALLPLAYLIGYKTRWKNVFAEYFSGTLYGAALAGIMFFN